MKDIRTLLDDYEVIEIEHYIYKDSGGESAVLYVESRTNPDTIACQFEIPWEHVKDYVPEWNWDKICTFERG